MITTMIPSLNTSITSILTNPTILIPILHILDPELEIGWSLVDTLIKLLCDLFLYTLDGVQYVFDDFKIVFYSRFNICHLFRAVTSHLGRLHLDNSCKSEFTWCAKPKIALSFCGLLLGHSIKEYPDVHI